MLTFNRILDKESKRYKDENGFLYIKDNPIAMGGVFEYLLSELEPDTRPENDRIVKVYRPFDKLAEVKDTFANKPIKYNHKWVGEEAEQADGAIGSEIRVDEPNMMLRADLIIYNPELIEAIEKDNIIELSPGYTDKEIKQSGRFNGEDYEYVQEIVCVNHLAVVDKGRSGYELRIQDENKLIKEFKKMKKSYKDRLLSRIKRILDEDAVKKDEEQKQDNDTTQEDNAKDIVKQIIELAIKPTDEFAGGEEERENAIIELAKQISISTDEETTQDEECEKQDEDTENKQDNDKTEKQDEETTEDNEVETIKPEELAEVVSEATEAIVEKKINEFVETQEKENKQITDSYIKVSNALGTTFNYNGMKAKDIYKFGYEALTGETLNRQMDSKTAFDLALQFRNKTKNNRIGDSVKTNTNEILELLNKNY